MNTQINKEEQLLQIYKLYLICSQCPLKRTDEHFFIFGSGNVDARLMIIGEAPGRNEEEKGAPFIGRSGQLLTKTLESLGVKRADVFITNIVKCRPQNNRTPLKKEIAAYKNLLLKQIEIIKPKAICTLGSVAAYGLIKTIKKMDLQRDTINYLNNIPIISTYHPAYILRNITKKSFFCDDIQKAINLSAAE